MPTKTVKGDWSNLGPATHKRSPSDRRTRGLWPVLPCATEAYPLGLVARDRIGIFVIIAELDNSLSNYDNTLIMAKVTGRLPDCSSRGAINT